MPTSAARIRAIIPVLPRSFMATPRPQDFAFGLTSNAALTPSEILKVGICTRFTRAALQPTEALHTSSVARIFVTGIALTCARSPERQHLLLPPPALAAPAGLPARAAVARLNAPVAV